MTAPADPLKSIRVLSPCKVSWDGMQGDDRSRFCGTCSKSVYNLSGLTRAEAEKLVGAAPSDAPLCVRLFRRHDGTVVTSDCSGGGWASAVLAKLLYAGGTGMAALMLLTGVTVGVPIAVYVLGGRDLVVAALSHVPIVGGDLRALFVALFVPTMEMGGNVARPLTSSNSALPRPSHVGAPARPVPPPHPINFR